MPNVNDPHDVLPKLLLAIAFAGELVLTFVIAITGLLMPMALVNCPDRACGAFAYYLLPVVAAVVVVVTGMLALVLRNRGFRALLVPAGGALCLIGTGFAADLLLQRALAG